MQLFVAVQYLPGGVASAFRSVASRDDTHSTRLLHLKGSRMVRVRSVVPSAASLNSGDVFIVDLGGQIIQWNGASSKRKGTWHCHWHTSMHMALTLA